MKTAFRNPEVLFTLALTVISFISLMMSFNLGFGSLKEPGSGLFPAFTSLLGLVLGILLIIHHLVSQKGTGSSKAIFEKGEVKRFIAMIVTFCAWLILMPWLGFIIVTFWATLAFAKIMGEKGWLLPILLAIGTSVFIYFLFDVWFYADLPRGFLGI